MNANQVQTNSQNRGTVKPTPLVTINLPSPKPTRQETMPPSDADIAIKAYEIWLAHGQEMGNDQHYWFEAKRQLRQR